MVLGAADRRERRRDDMRFLKPALVLLALLLAASTAWAEIETFKGFQWEDQPWTGYVSGAVSVDGLGSLVVNSSAGTKTTILPGSSASESYGGAKLLLSGPFPYIHTKVFDARTTGQHGWAVLLYDDTGKVLDFGVRYTPSAVGYVAARVYDGSAWSFSNIHDRNSGDKYYTIDFVQNPDGTITVSTDEWVVAGGGAGLVTYTTPIAYGNITEIYLTASSSNKTSFNYKYTEFLIPEPGSMLALGSAVLALAGCAMRRRRA